MIVVVALAIITALLAGLVVGAWLALEWMRRLRPGREGDLLAELAALRASAGLHQAALDTQAKLWQVVSQPPA